MDTDIDIDTIREVAAAHREREMVAWAHEHFPGITNLGRRTVNWGDPADALVGDWHGLPIQIGEQSGDRRRASLVPLCETCHQHVPAIGVGALRDAGTLAAVAEADLVAVVAECDRCAWLARTQAAARAATSGWSRFWFNFARPFTAEEILAVSPGDPIPNSRPDLF